MACAASLAVQEVIEEEDLLSNVRAQGKYLGRYGKHIGILGLKSAFRQSNYLGYVFAVQMPQQLPLFMIFVGVVYSGASNSTTKPLKKLPLISRGKSLPCLHKPGR